MGREEREFWDHWAGQARTRRKSEMKSEGAKLRNMRGQDPHFNPDRDQAIYNLNKAMSGYYGAGGRGLSTLRGKRGRRAAKSTRPKTDAKDAMRTFRGFGF